MSNDKELWEKVNKVETEVQHKNGKKEDALLDLFREAMMSSVDTGGALRTVELCKLFGWGAPRVREFLRTFKAAGLIEVVKIQLDASETLSGARSWATAYRLIEKDTET